jgi:hypothetical protein
VRQEGLCSFVLLELPAPTKQLPGAAAKWTKILLSRDKGKKGKKVCVYVCWLACGICNLREYCT